MASLRPLIAQGRKRLGFLIGAGAPAGICPNGSTEPLIPAVSGLTGSVLKALDGQYRHVLDALLKEMESADLGRTNTERTDKSSPPFIRTSEPQAGMDCSWIGPETNGRSVPTPSRSHER